jgi:hypothetical protein
MIGLSLITLVAIYVGPETYQRDISVDQVDKEAVRPETTRTA